MAEQDLCFTALGNDILSIIVSLLAQSSPSSLQKLSLASKYCKKLVDPLLYRAIELNDKDEEKLAFTRQHVQRLLDPKSGLSQHVRDLKISHFTGRSENFGALELEEIISRLFRLHSFRWDTNATIPERVISRLEQQWPNTMLMVNNYDRADTDTRLLLSPLLYSLSFGVLNSTATVTSTHQLEQFSRLPDLKDILLKTPNLKILDIRFKYNWMYRAVKWTGKSATPHLLNLPLNPRDRLPTLHELSFSGPPETYELDLRHCQLLKQCMDWSQLYRLDIGINCPQHFFEEIGSCLLNLKSLTMGVRTGERRYGHWTCGPLTCDDLGPVIRFIESVPDLHDLCITDLDAAVETLVPTILASQRSLQNFSYLASRHRRHQRQKIPHAWTPAQLLDLRQRCPNLSHLTIDFPLDNGKWPTNHATAIPHFTHLQSLQIVVELNESASDFAAEYHQTTWGEVPTPPFNEQLGREVTTDLFKSIFENDPYAHLEDLQVVFTRTEVYDRGQSSDIEFPIKVRRLERDDAPSPGEGGFSVKCKGKWLGGWL